MGPLGRRWSPRINHSTRVAVLGWQRSEEVRGGTSSAGIDPSSPGALHSLAPLIRPVPASKAPLTDAWFLPHAQGGNLPRDGVQGVAARARGSAAADSVPRIYCSFSAAGPRGGP